MNVLSAALTEAMTTSSADLVVFEPETRTWHRHPWGQVHLRAQNVAERIGQDGSSAVGIVGEPTVEGVAAILGALLAGSAVSILPGLVRGADPDQWADSTLNRFANIGVTTVFSHGSYLEQLRTRDSSLVIHDDAEVAHAQRSTTLELGAPLGEFAVLQGTADPPGPRAPHSCDPTRCWRTCAASPSGSAWPAATSAARGCRCTTTWA